MGSKRVDKLREKNKDIIIPDTDIKIEPGSPKFKENLKKVGTKKVNK